MKDGRYAIRWPPDLLARVDEWRKRQPGPPSKAAALRWLVERGLEFGEARSDVGEEDGG